MSEPVRDPHTGYLTTGHEWNGTTELNTPVPRPVWWFMSVSHLAALVVVILLPAIPLWYTYSKGLLGADQQAQADAAVARALDKRSGWASQVETQPFADIQADAALMENVRGTGATVFGTNCAACHGANGVGGPGFPRLSDDDWLWGNDPEVISEILRTGINWTHQDTRLAQMPAFGLDGILTAEQVDTLVPHVMGLSVPGTMPDSAAATLFGENCASCHGENGKGLQEMGTPNLADDTWLYGGDAVSIRATLWKGRQGQMPAWEERLSEVDRKLLTLYVLGLGK
jgi:cytochrome c oxidase cbb3-type subunit 3